MKKIILLLTVCSSLLTINYCFAQKYYPFPTKNAIWTQLGTNIYGSADFHFQYVINGDTNINSLIYHKLYTYNSDNDTAMTLKNLTLIGTIREDNFKRIYFNNYRIYDFSKRIGDTINFHFAGETSEFVYTLTVNDIDSVIVYDTYRRQFHLSDGQIWIEGIGGIAGFPGSLLSSLYSGALCDCSDDLICYKYDDTTFYMNPLYKDCYPRWEKKSLNLYKIFPK